ncbi:hypothetical protein OF83DRAFT_807914 [Amylostereum chailletii]|nr:hypothetical protein OF83DRAFT_807914 [Amylostereum chailletii]
MHLRATPPTAHPPPHHPTSLQPQCSQLFDHANLQTRTRHTKLKLRRYGIITSGGVRSGEPCLSRPDRRFPSVPHPHHEPSVTSPLILGPFFPNHAQRKSCARTLNTAPLPPLYADRSQKYLNASHLPTSRARHTQVSICICRPCGEEHTTPTPHDAPAPAPAPVREAFAQRERRSRSRSRPGPPPLSLHLHLARRVPVRSSIPSSVRPCP